MLFNAATFASLTLFASSAVAHSIGHEHLHRKRQAPANSDSTVITTGSTNYGDNQMHSRLEISDMAKNRPDQWNLMIGALRNWMDADTGSANGTSYFEIAGIHGMPRVDWNGVEACPSCGDADGYCTHDICLFPAWHRAYMAQFEQTFLSYVWDLANQYTGTKKQTMLDAASTMRFAYWDWAAKPDPDSGNVFPAFLSAPEIIYDSPTGQQQVANPLYSYTYLSQADYASMYFTPFYQWAETLRYPNTNDADAVSNDAMDVSAFNNLQANIADQVYSLFGCNDYLHFSNDAAGATQNCPNSIEGIHNTIHMTSGGPGANGTSGGHMTYLPEAAFDVLFFLHHANVDRLTALWQTVNPNSWGAQCTAPHDTWTIAQGETVDQNTGLKPFKKDANDFWTTADIEDFTQLGYTYPELAITGGNQQAVIGLINQLYGPNANATASSFSSQVEQESADSNSGRGVSATSASVPSGTGSPIMSMSLGLGGLGGSVPTGVPGLGANSGSNGGVGGIIGGIAGAIGGAVGAPTGTAPFPNITIPYSSSFGSNGSQYTYTCHCQAPRYSLNGSYEIYVFDQEPQSSDATTWLGDQGCIGTIGVLAGGGGMSDSDVHVTGAIPMTRHLQHRCDQGSLSGMSSSAVVPYLTNNLQWKIVKNGQEIHPSQIPTFQAAVYSGKSTSPSVNGLPKLTQYVPQIGITKNKAGGAQAPPSWMGHGSGSNTGSSSGSSSSPCPSSSQAAAVPQSSQAGASQPSPIPAHPYQAPPAAPYAPANNSAPVWQPTATGTGSYSTATSTLAPYTGAASKSSYSFAALAVAAGLAAIL